MLYAFGDGAHPLRSTARALDDAVTDFVVELCHEAEARARTAGRSKVKVDDFTFALRRDGAKVGRVQELADLERYIRRERQSFNPKKQLRAAVKEAGAAAPAGPEDKGGGGKIGEGEGGGGEAGEVEMEDVLEGGLEGKADAVEAHVKVESEHDLE
jgi:transcription initiation factor TFIID subunit 13